MQASTYAVKGSIGLEVRNCRVLPGFGELRKKSPGVKNLCITDRGTCCKLRLGSLTMGAELGRAITGDVGVFRSSVKARSVRAQASDGELESLASTKPRGKSSGIVLPYVGVACLGAILFGYHLGYMQTMIVGRLLAGIGIGISYALVPLYISEISPTEIRGALGSVNQLFICIGILAALVAGLPLAGNPLWL